MVEQKLALILALCSQHTLGQPVYYVIFSKKKLEKWESFFLIEYELTRSDLLTLSMAVTKEHSMSRD